jgi:predicted amidophosphoribosyltransferase
VPVPLAPGDLRRRGFNQAAWLARPIAASLGVPVTPDCLYRIADDGPQAGRQAAERRRRRNPFRAGALPLEAARVLLVDDVCTTGTTITQAATALLCAGALRVDAAVLLNSDRRVSR